MCELKASKVNKEGSFIPNCEKNGLFKSKQCDTNQGCWCVDIQTGVELANTRVPQSDDIDCGMFIFLKPGTGDLLKL